MSITKEKLKNVLFIILIVIICVVICKYQNRKIGFHEDEVYSIVSSVNQYNGLMSAYAEKDTTTVICEKHIFNENFFVEIKNIVECLKYSEQYSKEMKEIDRNAKPIWRTNEDVKNFATLTPNNYLNLKAIYFNQTKDNHPPVFYTLVHFSAILFGGEFTKYSVFVVNILAFIFSCFVIKKILGIINKRNLLIPSLILYGLSMGTISMVIYQRMYMLLTLFILLYFYYSLHFYKNNFNMDSKVKFRLGVVTVLGFLTQYYFAIYAVAIFIIMIAKMAKDRNKSSIIRYIKFHFVYAIIGILLFLPCLYHLVFSDKGIENIVSFDYFERLFKYIKYLLYAFTIKENLILGLTIIIATVVAIIYCFKKTKEKFIITMLIAPTLFYIVVVTKLTEYQEFRYIMPVIPFIVMAVLVVLNEVMKFKYKNYVLIAVVSIIVINGLICSKPKFLYEEYDESLKIAEENKDKAFVYVYDNKFNHMQSVPEMMIYKKSIVINNKKGEMDVIINSEELNQEDSYILCIKTYMNNEDIINNIKENTNFNNVTQLYSGGNASDVISNNLYLVSK